MGYDDSPTTGSANSTAGTSSPSSGGGYTSAQQWNDLTIKFNLVASLLSCVSSGIVLIIMALSPKARSTGNLARTVLLLSLFFFDFINSTFNSTTGILKVMNQLVPGRFCEVEGFIGQWSVQGSDLATFALAVVTFVVAHAASNLETLSRRLQQVESSILWVAVAIFVIPLITATIGYVLVGMTVTGSWCWFNKDPKPLATYVRYSLTHGPRIFIIFSIIVMYAVLFWAFRVRIREQESILSSTYSAQGSNPASANSEKAGNNERRNSRFGASRKNVWGEQSSMPESGAVTMEEERAYQQIRAKADAQRAAIMKLLVYPTAYTLLWLPGLFNRFAEASNQSADFQNVTTFFQFTTQLIGFANSVIFGYARFFGKANGNL
ncbi:hypothetical protein HDU97_005740 [Phlyctochytrium planicorne]|nr:hypothetical protein HDU97_005740 [Phlyctochytrium planicorne]